MVWFDGHDDGQFLADFLAFSNPFEHSPDLIPATGPLKHIIRMSFVKMSWSKPFKIKKYCDFVIGKVTNFVLVFLKLTFFVNLVKAG